MNFSAVESGIIQFVDMQRGIVIICVLAVNLLAKPHYCSAQNQQASPSNTSSSQRNQEARTNAEASNASTPHWYASSEWWLVIIAALTGAAIAYQAYQMRRTIEVMEGQLEDIKKQTTLLGDYVQATKDGVEATRQAAEAARDSARIQAQTVTLQYRPKIVVRRAELEYGSLAVGGRPPVIHYIAANIGGTESEIVNVNGIFGYWNSPGWGTPEAYSQKFDIALSSHLKAGEDRQFTIEIDDAMFDKISFVQTQGAVKRTNTVMVGELRICAEIKYTDAEGIARKTGIYRALDIESLRFKPIKDDEYEYAD